MNDFLKSHIELPKHRPTIEHIGFRSYQHIELQSYLLTPFQGPCWRASEQRNPIQDARSCQVSP
jgi:hypothetical protein